MHQIDGSLDIWIVAIAVGINDYVALAGFEFFSLEICIGGESYRSCIGRFGILHGENRTCFAMRFQGSEYRENLGELGFVIGKRTATAQAYHDESACDCRRDAFGESVE